MYVVVPRGRRIPPKHHTQVAYRVEEKTEQNFDKRCNKTTASRIYISIQEQYICIYWSIYT